MTTKLWHGSRLLLFVVLGGCSYDAPPQPDPPAVETPVTEKPTAKPVPPVASPAVKPPPKVETPPKAVVQDEQLRRRLSELTYLEAGQWKVRKSTVEEIEQSPGDITESVVFYLGDKSADVRRGATFFLFDRFEPESEAMRQAFLARLSDDDPTVRRLAVQVVSRLPDEVVKDVLPRLADALQRDRDDANFRAAIVRRIGSLEAGGKSVASVVAAVAKDDPSPQVRSAALMAMFKLDEGSSEHVDLYRQSLADADARVRLVAAGRLKQLGGGAAPATKELAAALEDKDLKVRDAARDALVEIGPVVVVPVAERLQSSDPLVRQAALIVLGRLGPAAKAAAPAIRKCLQDSNETVKKLAQQAIQRVEGPTP